VLLDFWATWCAPCAASLPLYDAWQRELADAGLTVVAVSTDDDDADVAGFAAQHMPNVTVWRDRGGALAAALGVTAMPTAFLMGRDGAILGRHGGFEPEDAEGMLAALRAALEGDPELAGGAGAGRRDEGGHRGATSLSAYLDDDATEVITSVTRVSASPWSGGRVDAGYLVDAISSASVDVVSGATEAFVEQRHAATAAVSQRLGDQTVRLNYGFSIEVGRQSGELVGPEDALVSDYLGHGFGVGADFELFERNTTLSLDYAAELGTIGRSGDANFARSLTTHAADVRLSQVLSRSLVAEAGWSFAAQLGYTAKPYRFARVGQVVAGVCRGCPPETHPEERYRNALFVGAKLHLFAESAVELRYRLYVDTWALLGHTVEALLHLGWSRHFGVRVRYRVHHQGAASFYQDVYAAPARYMTGDRELGPLTSQLAGVLLFARLERVIGLDAIEITGKVDLFRFDYHDFSLLTERMGLVAELGLAVEL
jgi:thiol-disulfide isomerase/thioredoxin